ncbi:MAG: hypothetical protein COA92_04280 [Sulfurovum sp.]|nr:MAG: hypothetical protein COA92_04280 [Sulfurovum sp.]
MFFRFSLFLFFAITIAIHGYSDYDVDGVEDSVDACPYTPFDVLVDERGCEEGKKYSGALTLLGGTITGIDTDTDNLTNFLLFVNYRYYDWDISLSTFNEIQNTVSDVPDTFYISTGYSFKLSDRLESKVSIGTKQSSLQDDYYFMGNVDYSINSEQNIYLFYSYTFAQDSDTEVYDNFHTYSIGTGRIFTDYWYSALSYDFSGSNLSYIDDYQAMSWSNNFLLSSQYYILTTYSYGLSDAASDHTVSIQFGVKFE